MLATVTFDQAQITRVRPGHAATEASQMNLEPGYWPEFVAVLNPQGTGFLFQRGAPIDPGAEDFAGYAYWHRQSGLRLDIFND